MTSSRSRLAASRRTPQEISNPTPPGETTPPAAGSVAATPPIGNPYPRCRSGIAYDAVTMPGKVATLATCSSERSAARSGISSREAYTIPGTRICSALRDPEPVRAFLNKFHLQPLSLPSPAPATCDVSGRMRRLSHGRRRPSSSLEE